MVEEGGLKKADLEELLTFDKKKRFDFGKDKTYIFSNLFDFPIGKSNGENEPKTEKIFIDDNLEILRTTKQQSPETQFIHYDSRADQLKPIGEVRSHSLSSSFFKPAEKKAASTPMSPNLSPPR